MRHILRFQHINPAFALSVVSALTLMVSACGGYGGGGGSAGGQSCGGPYSGACAAPTITVASPGATVDRTVQLKAGASAASGASVTRVDFLIDGTIVGTATAAPFSASWDSTTVVDGTHTLVGKVTDNMSQTTSSALVTFKVNNNPTFTVEMAATQLFPAPQSAATGTASVTVKLATGAVSGKVNLTGIVSTAVTINEGFAGAAGPGLIALARNGATAGEWDVPAGSLLTTEQVNALLQGKLYVKAASAANPNGEIRGQIAPANISVIFADLSGAQEVPAVVGAAAGVAATTVDAQANTVSVHVHATGVDDATAAEVDNGAAGSTGTKLVALTQDAVQAGHWSTELAAITATDVDNFKANKWYVNVATPAQVHGAIRGQIDFATTAPPPAPTLTQLKTSAFSVCGGCHTGGGASLPSSMDLTPNHIFASLVNVASVEQPALKRVAARDAANSYVVQKLEGAATITGSRMPLGGPFLDQATIDQVKAWINAGAQNN